MPRSAEQSAAISNIATGSRMKDPDRELRGRRDNSFLDIQRRLESAPPFTESQKETLAALVYRAS